MVPSVRNPKCVGTTRKSPSKAANAAPTSFPAKSVNSRLIHFVGGLDPDLIMPQKGHAKLTRAQVGLLRAWIDQGASWPGKRFGQVPNPRNHWSFKKRPVRPATPPSITKNGRAIPIDYFVLSKLEAKGLAPSAEADRSILIRRVSLDLDRTASHPRGDQRFCRTTAARTPTKKLSSACWPPAITTGERWARHWLDAVRYAGFPTVTKKTWLRSIYPYRDWVIDAYNDNMPFDEFTTEQLAGDLDAAFHAPTRESPPKASCAIPHQRRRRRGSRTVSCAIYHRPH